jgi:CitMHS family citrate-Mg2+:H+ or citrate-Ca2+:H+ symporter
MLSLLGFLTIAVFLVLIFTKRLSVLLALILVPVCFALVGGFAVKDIGSMIIAGISQVAPTGIMLIFAVLYFGIMIDAGLFDPVISGIVRLAKGDPLRITIGHRIAHHAGAFGWRWHSHFYDYYFCIVAHL